MPGGSRRFSKSALCPALARWTEPGHRPTRGDPQRVAFAGEPRAVRRGRLADHGPERPAERAEAAEPDVEADLGDRPTGLAEQFHRPLHPAALQVAMGRFAERGP